MEDKTIRNPYRKKSESYKEIISYDKFFQTTEVHYKFSDKKFPLWLAHEQLSSDNHAPK